MELLCAVERFHHENRKTGVEQRESLNMPVQSVDSPVQSQTEYSGVGICCSTCRDSGVTVRSHGDPSPFREGLGETLAVHCRGQQVF